MFFYAVFMFAIFITHVCRVKKVTRESKVDALFSSTFFFFFMHVPIAVNASCISTTIGPAGPTGPTGPRGPAGFGDGGLISWNECTWQNLNSGLDYGLIAVSMI